VLKLEDVHFSYGTRPVLTGASLEVPDGEVVALLGRTGSGKSTALRLLAGLEKPARGRVFVGKSAVAGDGFSFVAPEKRRVGVVFQSGALWPHMTVTESLMFVAAGGADAAAAEKATVAILEELDIAHLADRRPGQLSGGEAALAAVARALAQSPRALLLDEPFSGLDANRRASIRDLVFRRARARSIPAVYVTHLREEVMSSVDRLAVLSGGRVQQCAAPREVYARPSTAEVARLTGEVALLPAEITAQNVVTPIGAFDRSAAPRAEELGTGWKGLLALRPESIRLAGDGNISGIVKASEFRGGRPRLVVASVGPGGVELRVDSERELPSGSEVRLQVRGDLALVGKES
jgi:ABC-type Fe3+/spermidine/putrescine transport system ATPase subunit